MAASDEQLFASMVRHATVALSYADEAGRNWHRDPKTVDAVCKRLEQIGELAKRVSPRALAARPQVDWRAVKGMREVLAHDYEEVDVDIVREVVDEHLPALLGVLGDPGGR